MNGRVFYNESDPFAASWLEELIAARAIPAGTVDRRDIRDVRPADLDGYDQCHFFAGIAGWAEAIRLAGLSGVRGLWSGSCPCQPFSTAGRRLGFADERHLWPSWFHLIERCRPDIVCGEQVSGAAGLAWLDLVCDDLEGCGYTVRAEARPACSVGAPHKRERLWFCAVAESAKPGWRAQPIGDAGEVRRPSAEPRRLCDAGGAVANSLSPRLEGRDARSLGHERETAERSGETDACTWSGGNREPNGNSGRPFGGSDYGSATDRPRKLGDAGREGRRQVGAEPGARGEGSRAEGLGERPMHERACGHWSDVEWLPCRDGKSRPAQPGIQPLAHGVPNRVGTLRGAGNAINPYNGASFLMDALA